MLPTGEFIVTRTRESHPRLNLRLDGTLASPPPGCRVRLRTAPDAGNYLIGPRRISSHKNAQFSFVCRALLLTAGNLSPHSLAKACLLATVPEAWCRGAWIHNKCNRSSPMIITGTRRGGSRYPHHHNAVGHSSERSLVMPIMISAQLIVSERLATGWRGNTKHCFPVGLEIPRGNG